MPLFNARDKSTSTAPSQTQSAQDAPDKRPTEAPATSALPLSDDPKGAPSPPTSDPPSVSPANGSNPPPVAGPATRTPNTNRRWSFQGHFKLLRKPNAPRSTVEKHAAAVPPTTSNAPTDRAKPSAPSNANRRAKQSALIVRSLIVGQDTDEGGLAPPRERTSGTQMKNVKAQLLKPKMAGKVIAELRALPAFADPASRAGEPIQAVCLPYSDEEADKKHLSNNIRNVKATTTTTRTPGPSSPIGGITIDAVAEAIRNLHIVSLFTSPDLGLGEPGDGPGILAGALPTAETVLTGVTQITPQLMALGYATGKPFIPSDKDIHPPTDRMSILTYWWGLELLLPPPTLAYLSRAHSISGTIMNVLTALGVMYAGVREILPFVRYFSQYIDFEFKSIQAQNHGKGVICAATWIMPAALVPRPWDFPDPPSSSKLHVLATMPPPAKAPATVPVPTLAGQTAPPVSESPSSGVAPGSPASPSPAPPISAPK